MIKTLSVERDGKTYQANYSFEGGMVVVYTISARKEDFPGRMDVEVFAKILLNELIEEGKISPIKDRDKKNP